MTLPTPEEYEQEYVKPGLDKYPDVIAWLEKMLPLREEAIREGRKGYHFGRWAEIIATHVGQPVTEGQVRHAVRRIQRRQHGAP